MKRIKQKVGKNPYGIKSDNGKEEKKNYSHFDTLMVY